MQSDDLLGFAVTIDPETAIENHFDPELGDGSSQLVFACLNPHSFVEAQSNAAFSAALSSADVLAADGVGITYAARLLGLVTPKRFTGSECFDTICNLASSERPIKMFLLGSTNDVLARLVSYLGETFANVEVVGVISPPYMTNILDWDAAEAITDINASKPDVLWVSMTAPKQELWVHRNAERLDVRFIGSIGAVFDFYAGTVKRPARAWRALGLEWLVRLVREPKRLWRRTAISGTKFVLIVAGNFIRKCISQD